MGDIYANAACTIAATAAKNSSSGLFFNRSPQSICPREIEIDFSPEAFWLEGKIRGFAMEGTYLCDVRLIAQSCIERAPLNRRAWVCQERQLSRRLLHCADGQLSWECHECLACETYPERLPHCAKPWWRYDATALKSRLCDILQQAGSPLSQDSIYPRCTQAMDIDTYNAWLTFVEQYSRCALTLAADKLVAIRGIAKLVSEMTGDTFVAGLWQGRIIEELCWSKEPSMEDPLMEPTEWRAPTWSWACSDMQICRSLLYKFHDLHNERRIEAEVVDVDTKAEPSGELRYASMKVRCKPLQAIYSPIATGKIRAMLEIGQKKSSLMLMRFEKSPRTSFYGDVPDVSETLVGYVVVMQACFHDKELSWPAKDEDCVEALFIRSRDDGGEQFERIGIFSFDGRHAVEHVLKAHRVAKEEIITLV